MNKWFIRFELRNGSVYTGYFLSDKTDSNQICQELFSGTKATFVNILSNDNTSLGFYLGDIVVYQISSQEFKGESE